MLPNRYLRILLWLSGVSCLLAGTVFLITMQVTPISASNEELLPIASLATERAEDAPVEILISESDLQEIWSKVLQGPLIDAAKVETKKKSVAPVVEKQLTPVRLEAKLVGTLVDSDSTYGKAWIELGRQIHCVREGGVIGHSPTNVKIARIKSREVVVEYADQTIHLALPLSSAFQAEGEQ